MKKVGILMFLVLPFAVFAQTALLQQFLQNFEKVEKLPAYVACSTKFDDAKGKVIDVKTYSDLLGFGVAGAKAGKILYEDNNIVLLHIRVWSNAFGFSDDEKFITYSKSSGKMISQKNLPIDSHKMFGNAQASVAAPDNGQIKISAYSNKDGVANKTIIVSVADGTMTEE